MPEVDDLAALLPEPPPPHPLRREAAIEAALRRFDGAPPRAVEPKSRRARPAWWAGLTRPQIGIAASTALVAVIAVPVAWVALNDPQTLPRRAETSAAREPFAPPDPSRPIARSPDSVVASDQAVAPAGPAMKPSVAQSSAPVLAAKAAEASPGERPTASVVAPPAILFAAPPPPPPPAMAAAESMEDAGSNIIVTGARARRYAGLDKRNGGGGDRDACTLDDPRQPLDRCQSVLGRIGPGREGQAAARVSDGLSLGWGGDIAGATVEFDRAIAIDPRNVAAYLNRGLARARSGDLDRALADLDKAVRLAPNAARGYHYRADVLRRRGEERRARADELRAADLDPRYEDAPDR